MKADLKKLVKVSSGTAVPNLLLGDLKKHVVNIPKSLIEQINMDTGKEGSVSCFPEWDGEPEEPPETNPVHKPDTQKQEHENRDEEKQDKRCKLVKIKLRDGKEREIQHMVSTSFWGKYPII